MKMPLGYKKMETYTKDGKLHIRWKLRWWYAIYLAMKTAFTMILEDEEPNTEHIEEDGEEGKDEK